MAGFFVPSLLLWMYEWRRFACTPLRLAGVHTCCLRHPYHNTQTIHHSAPVTAVALLAQPLPLHVTARGESCGELDTSARIQTFSRTHHSPPSLPTMQRVVPQRARQLWGHAPRVRSFNNRQRRTFASVSGSEQYFPPLTGRDHTHLTLPDPTMSSSSAAATRAAKPLPLPPAQAPAPPS